MREIKFRGYNDCAKQWFYGDLVRGLAGSTGECFIFYDNDKTTPDKIIVDPASVGQFTGLHDKNGKEIYEGDFIEGSKYSGIVEWQPDCAQFVGWLGDEPFGLWYDNDYEVLGNIYDNPGLKEL